MKAIDFIDLVVAMEATAKYCAVLSDGTRRELVRSKKAIRRSQLILDLIQ